MLSIEHYYVNFDVPKCTCDNFFRYFFPYQHTYAKLNFSLILVHLLVEQMSTPLSNVLEEESLVTDGISVE